MKCSHEPCTCQVEDATGYCGPSCRTGIADEHSGRCYCGHADCEALTGEST